MHQAYALVTGPLAWIAGLLFFGGSLYRIIRMGFLARAKDPMVYTFWDNYYAGRSILHWIFPFASHNSRAHPWLSLVTFLFHVSLLISPLFLYAHVLLVFEAWGVAWWTIPDTLADIMAFTVVGGCIFFAVRRMTRPEVRYLSTWVDFALLLLVAAPFFTGIWAYHQWPFHRVVFILHILSGEVLLAAIPFTRLSHMLFFPFTRGYMGSEFGGVRHAQDW